MARPGLLQRIRDDERGAGYLGAFIVLFGVLTLAGVGVLFDSARMVSAQRHASAVAFEAARAGAQSIDTATLRSGGSGASPGGAEAAATQAAGALLAGSDAQLQDVTVSGNEVIVTVTRHVEPWFPMLSSETISETASVRIEEGS